MTGILTASTMARVISSIFGIFCSIPAPAPFPATLFTGQPKFMSRISGLRLLYDLRSFDHRFRIFTINLNSYRAFFIADTQLLCILLTARISASLDTNSVYTMSAPNFLHIRRKAGSVTSSIGARRMGCSPRSIWSIFMYMMN